MKATANTIETRRFGYSASEQALFDAARAIAARYAPLGDSSLGPDELRAIFRDLAPLGYLGSILPISAGGSSLSPLEFGAIVDGLAPELTLIGNHSVQRYLHEFGSAAQCERFLPGLLSGEAVGAIAITEPGAGSNLHGISTVSRRTERGYVLDGRKTWVTHGLHATFLIVLARLEDGTGGTGLTRFIMPGDTPGLSRRRLDTVGLRHLTFAEVDLDSCEVGADLRLGDEGAGVAGAKNAFPIARALAALQALRIAEAALDMAAAYCRDRGIATGPLSNSSLVQDRYADLSSRCDAAKLLALRAMSELGEADSTSRASGAKALACSLGLEACRWASDTMGSIALDSNHPIQRLLNDARMMAVVDGTPVLNNLVVGRRLLRDGGAARVEMVA